jgi:hypothetical protein
MPGSQSSNEMVSTSADGKLASRRRATAARPAPSSTAVTAIPPLRQGHGRLPGAATDLSHPVSRSESGQTDQVVEYPGRAGRLVRWYASAASLNPARNLWHF